MPTNIGFDEHDRPYVETGADEGRIVEVGDRLAVEPIPTSPTHFTLERSIDGQTWESVLGDTPSPDGVTLIDWESLSYGDTLYRAIATTVEGATAVTEITVEARSIAIWLSGGVGFGETCRLPMNPDISRAPGRGRALKHYAGSEEPTAYSSERLTRVWQVGGRVTDRTFIEECATPDELVELIENPEALFLLRTPDGHRRYGAPKDPQLHRQHAGTYDPGEFRPWNAFWGFSFQFTEAKKEGA
ncbi:hypothetical protein PTQ19_07195 [Microbacterium esteraromaticum]|uniref:hypothetical protein n=1 Tax=Microbacterium esteraromaticum TaxID=57043 RepID=UPI0023678EF9|nr:hypothetical protein [Microbacterium esteraromaticum]WDH77940.1 hypothetical protein PTQ19_10440 [Microbacterium esteraromaticum]WDH80209.1 hypothetical protein PTQ19_07195 [Microbacterium esteraromaticum]